MEVAVEAPEDVTVILVKDTRYAMAFISGAYFGNPAEKLKTIGITGTKGKTTTTYMVKSILENAGYKVWLIGTIETIIGDTVIPSVDLEVWKEVEREVGKADEKNECDYTFINYERVK